MQPPSSAAQDKSPHATHPVQNNLDIALDLHTAQLVVCEVRGPGVLSNREELRGALEAIILVQRHSLHVPANRNAGRQFSSAAHSNLVRAPAARWQARPATLVHVQVGTGGGCRQTSAPGRLHAQFSPAGTGRDGGQPSSRLDSTSPSSPELPPTSTQAMEFVNCTFGF
jgi:hypothetical protein